MKNIMAFLQAGIISLWIIVPLITVVHAIMGNLEQVEAGLKVLGEMLGFEPLMITCMVGIYTVLNDNN